MSARGVLGGLAAAGLSAAPRVAQACAVCSSGREDDVQFAFIATTVFLSVLPLGMLGGAVWWLRRRLRELEASQARREAGLAAAASRD